MKKINRYSKIVLILSILLPTQLYCQFINNGCHLSLSSGIALVLDSLDFTNQTSTYDGDITSSGKIFIKGNLTNSATGGQLFDSTTTAGEVTFYGYATKTISGLATHFYNLNIDNNAKVDVSPTNLIKVYNNFTNNGTFTLKTNTSRTAMLIDAGSASKLLGSGVYKFERYIPQGGWHYVSTPTVATSNSSNHFWGGALYNYNETLHNWAIVTNNQQLDIMTGYDAFFKNGNKTVVFEGKYNTGQISMMLTKNNDGYNFIGNPYPCTVDWDNSAGWVKTNIDNAIYIWDPALNNGQGDYMEYVSGVGNRGGTKYIPATQAFWVKCNNASGGSITIKNEAKCQSTAPYFRSVDETEIITISAIQNGFSNEATICFKHNATNNFDSKYDALKIFHSNVSIPQLYTISEDSKELAINSLEELNQNTIIPMFLKPGSDGICKLSFNLEKINPLLEVYLFDKQDNTMYDLRINSKVEVNALMSDNPGRFLLIFNKISQVFNSSNSANLSDDAENSVWYYENNIFINQKTESNQAFIQIFDPSGKIVTESYDIIKGLNIIPINLPKGFYFCRYHNDNHTTVIKFIIKS